jgi:phosphoglycerate dehydrogenase-like enzyme
MLGQADAVVCAAMYGETTSRMFDATAFAAMRPGALFVNVARGGLVDETALIAALDTRQVGGAGLDVFCGEPFPGPLATHPRVLATPHVGALTGYRLRTSAKLFGENVRRWKAGEPPLWTVNRPPSPR